MPPANFLYKPSFISNPGSWFWALTQELFEHKPSEMKYGGSRLSGIMLRTPDLPSDVRRVAERLSGGARRLKTFGAHVGMIAGKVADFTGHLPDMCTLNLYRDGDDYLRPHHDPEWLYGPTLDNVVIATVSFGAARTLRHREIGNLDTCSDCRMEDGSLALTKGTFQRDYFHEILKDDTADARLSLTFVCAQQDLPENSCWYLLSYTKEAREMLESNAEGITQGRDIDLPSRYIRFVGDFDDTVARWGQLDLEHGEPLAAFHPATDQSHLSLEAVLEKHADMKDLLPKDHPLVLPPEDNYLDKSELPNLDTVPWSQIPSGYMDSVKTRIYDEQYRRQKAEERAKEDAP